MPLTAMVCGFAAGKTLCADRADSGGCLCCDTARVLDCAQIEAAFSRRVVVALVAFFINSVCCAKVDAFAGGIAERKGCCLVPNVRTASYSGWVVWSHRRAGFGCTQVESVLCLLFRLIAGASAYARVIALVCVIARGRGRLCKLRRATSCSR